MVWPYGIFYNSFTYQLFLSKHFQKYKEVVAENNFLLLDLQSPFQKKPNQNPTRNKQKNFQAKTKTRNNKKNHQTKKTRQNQPIKTNILLIEKSWLFFC